jgi:RND family efflux transporter MFP subunit
MSTMTIPADNLPPPAAELAPERAVEHNEIGERPPAPVISLRKMLVGGLVLAAVLLAFYMLGKLPRHAQAAALQEESERIRTALPRVNTVLPKQSAPTLIATLPGDVQAMEETEIYPRTTGYLKKWHVDIGDHVEAGKLLAEIDAPEIMQQLSRSRATLDQLVAKAATAESTMNLAEITLKRNRSLPPGAISKQEIDESNAAAITARAAFKATEADIVAGQAEVQRYTELDSFSKITAPFAGTITARNIEIGQLVSAGSSNGQSLFRLAKTNPLRVYVNVPQIDAPGVKEDMPAKILVREQPGKPFPGTVSRTAKALDPITRTLRTEVLVPNDDGRLMVGSYVQVELEITRQHPPLLVPASALIFNASGMRVAVLDAENKVHFADVDVLGDYGTMIGVARGLEPTQRVVTNPGDRLAEGIKVQPDLPEKTSAK